MRLRLGAPQWFNEDNPELQAKCVDFPASNDYDPWYGSTPESEDDTQEMREAAYICHGVFDGIQCPLLASCLEFAMENNERYGVWGGTLPEERAELRKERRLLRLSQAGESQPAA